MTEGWVNPKYQDAVDLVQLELQARKDEDSMANCSNCGGSGKIIYIDKGKTKSLNCGACNGSGQV